MPSPDLWLDRGIVYSPDRPGSPETTLPDQALQALEALFDIKTGPPDPRAIHINELGTMVLPPPESKKQELRHPPVIVIAPTALIKKGEIKTAERRWSAYPYPNGVVINNLFSNSSMTIKSVGALSPLNHHPIIGSSAKVHFLYIKSHDQPNAQGSYLFSNVQAVAGPEWRFYEKTRPRPPLHSIYEEAPIVAYVVLMGIRARAKTKFKSYDDFFGFVLMGQPK